MYLKRENICGFKSFPDRAELEFGSGITAIVGPNGCGKTNISDAICWVLGEQSARSLRGEKMEDIVFHGTRERKSLGMAEVSLTFDNSDCSLPLEYSEVTISRRLFRSGESEYFINKVPCRLKDITELFLDTGVGVNAYSQWEISRLDLILNSSPRDRHFIFEEAAGIMKFKLHKKETLRKLEVTEQNIARLKDIILEVKRQIGSLERQVKKVEKYQQLKAELKEVEISLVNLELTGLKEKLSFQERGFRELEKRLMELTAKISQRETALEDLQLSLRDWEERYAPNLSVIERCNSQIAESQSKIQLAEEQLRNADKIIADLHLLIQENEKKLLEVELRRNKIFQEKGLLEKESIEKELRWQKLNELAQVSLQEWEIMEKNLRTQKEEISELLNQSKEQHNNLGRWELEEVNLNRQKQKIGERQDDNLKRQEVISQRKEKLFEEISQAEEGVINCQEKISSLRVGKDELQSKISGLEKGIMEQKVLLPENENRIYFLQELMEEYYRQVPGVRVLLEGDSSREGICGVLGDVIKVPREYEPALLAALGVKVNWIITENPVDAEKGREFLRREESGKVHFVPLTIFSGIIKQSINLPSGDGILGDIISFISCEKKYRPLIEYLLPDTLVVKDWGAAGELFRQGFSGKAVTLEGESISWPGIMLVGKEKVFSSLSRKKELEELNIRFQKTKEDLQQRERQKENEEQRLKEVFSQLQSWEGKLHSQEIFLHSKKVELQELEKNVSYLNQEKEALMREEAAILAELDKAKKQKKYFEELIPELSRKEEEGNKEWQQLQEKARFSQEKKDKLNAELVELRVEKATRKEKLLRLDDQCSQISQRKDETGQELERLSIRLQVQQGEITKGEELIKKEKQILSQSQEEKKQQETKLGEMKNNLNLNKKQLEAYQEELKNMRQEYQDVLNQKHQEEMLKMQLGLEIGHREQKLIAEFGITAKDISEPVVSIDRQEFTTRGENLRARLETLGPVNLVATEEYDDLKKRYQFMTQQCSDVESAKDSLLKLIEKIDQTSVNRFQEAFVNIRKNFQEVFSRLFAGGEADLILMAEEEDGGGVEIVAQPPGKRLQSISLLSGGERALVGIALLFGIFLWKPTPFCVLDEIDAPLDEANIGRFTNLLKEFSSKSQFIIITHSKRTMEIADTLYGVTMEESGVSKLVGVKFTPEGKVVVGDKNVQS